VIQVFGSKKHPDVRRALRFFAERRIPVHFVDFKIRGPSVGELRRFVQKFGVDGLLDRDARAFRDAGLHVARLTDTAWLARMAEHPEILRMPLVRNDRALTVGAAEAEWKTWM